MKKSWERQDMAGILEGLKVIDMGHFVAVPSTGAVFADWGAEVMKIRTYGRGRPTGASGPEVEAFRQFG